MAALDDLLTRVGDPALRADLERELAPLRGDRELGLVFERHLPEKVRLAGLPVRRGASVEVRADVASPTWQVVNVQEGDAHLIRKEKNGTPVTETRSVDQLVVVQEFGSPIYPGLRSISRIERGGNRPYHTVINSENYHALETLLYTCEGKVDVIYIDPPYNSGARDWKYNNDYVDGNDGYRHSKWLSFMEKRLLLAKRLLKTTGSGLIVTIDEKEAHRLGLLLEQVFRSARIQMISSVINPKGVVRDNEFSRSDEYLFFVSLGDIRLLPEGETGAEGRPLPWQQLRRTDITSARGTSKGGKAQFYPIYVEAQTGKIEAIGGWLEHGVDRNSAPSRPGCTTVFPVRDDGTEMNWGLTGRSLQKLLDNGFVKATSPDATKPQPFTVKYLTSGRLKDIQAGRATITGYDESGAAVVKYNDDVSQRKMATTNWNRQSHNAQYYGTALLKAMLPDRSFPFPKSLYAVEDALRFYVGDNPSALVVDFFGGSGTTSHAVFRLNRQDGGARRSILVTNNEVSGEEAESLSARGFVPGQRGWEAMGVFEHITRPRIEAAINGVTPSGASVVGDYAFVDEFPMAEGFEENVEFFALTYEDPDRIQLGAAFEAVGPLLWLMAGATGPRVEHGEGAWALPPDCRYGVLFDANSWPEFCQAVLAAKSVTHAFVVTDSDAVFQRVVAELPNDVDAVRLYESYLTSFAINTGTRS